MWSVIGARDSVDGNPARPSPAATPDGTDGTDESNDENPPDQIEATLAATRTAPMEPVAVSGHLDPARAGTELHVQLRNSEGRWVSFPLHPVVDESGRFNTYVEIGEPGTHALRVREPISGLTSDTLRLEVR